MASDIRVKICGLSTRESVGAAVDAGASYVGFVFFPKSPRHLPIEKARELAENVPTGIAKVALAVDATDKLLDRLVDSVPIDMLQLHGHETPVRVREVKERYGLPVMKAVGIAKECDLPLLDLYGEAADQLLVDAKPPPASALPGGNAMAFDWQLLAGRRWRVPWMLAGGLTAENVRHAIHVTGARQVDVSSGVECAPGRKDPNMIRRFVASARA